MIILERHAHESYITAQTLTEKTQNNESDHG